MITRGVTDVTDMNTAIMKTATMMVAVSVASMQNMIATNALVTMIVIQEAVAPTVAETTTITTRVVRGWSHLLPKSFKIPLDLILLFPIYQIIVPFVCVVSVYFIRIEYRLQYSGREIRLVQHLGCTAKNNQMSAFLSFSNSVFSQSSDGQ